MIIARLTQFPPLCGSDRFSAPILKSSLGVVSDPDALPDSHELQVVQSDGVHADSAFQRRVVKLYSLCQIATRLDDRYRFSKLITHDGGSALGLTKQKDTTGEKVSQNHLKKKKFSFS